MFYDIWGHRVYGSIRIASGVTLQQGYRAIANWIKNNQDESRAIVEYGIRKA